MCVRVGCVRAGCVRAGMLGRGVLGRVVCIAVGVLGWGRVGVGRGANPVSSLGGIIGQILLKFAISLVWGYDFSIN